MARVHSYRLVARCPSRANPPWSGLTTNPVFSTKDFKAVHAKYRALIPDYIKDYVSLNQFAA